MEMAGTQPHEGVVVGAHTIPLVIGEAVTGVKLIKRPHERVA